MSEPQKSFTQIYNEKHQHPVNRILHTIGIPTIVISLGVVFFNWRLGLAMFIFGWVLQFIGHFFEGNQPAFFKNPIYLLVGPFWWLKKLISGENSKNSAS